MKNLTPLYLLLLSGTVLVVVLCITFLGSKPKTSQLYEYEYIMTVDGTDSVNRYSIYDNVHNFVGNVTADKLDSLINADNQ